jgi:hypothetical protein
VNRYNLPFRPFIGVNHHWGTIVFADGIISDEVVGSYVWLLQTFFGDDALEASYRCFVHQQEQGGQDHAF